MPGLLRRRKALGSMEGAWFDLPWGPRTSSSDTVARQREHYTTDFMSVVLQFKPTTLQLRFSARALSARNQTKDIF